MKSLTLIALLPTLILASCPDESWVEVGDSCYNISSEAQNWFQAEEYCAKEGGYLIEIQDEDEQASLFSFLSPDNWYWIGLSDSADEGVYKWQSTYDEAKYEFWTPNEPEGGSQDCVFLWNDYTWADWYCDDFEYNGHDIRGLCEMPSIEE